DLPGPYLQLLFCASRQVGGDHEAVLIGDLAIMHAQETAPAVTSPCDQRPAPAARNPLWIFDNLKHVVVIAGELVMVLDDVQPALVGEADGDAVLGGGD